MSLATRRRRAWPEFALLAIAIAVLGLCLFYGTFGVLLRPELGFRFDSHTGEVIEVPSPCEPPEICVREGDRVVAIGGVPYSTFLEDRTATLYDPLDRIPRTIEITVERAGGPLVVPVTPRLSPWSNAVVNLAVLTIPLVFWLAGTVAVVFLRPRNEAWLVFVAWSFLTAIWFAAGFTSETHLGYSSHVFHAAIWVWIAAVVHLHLALPVCLFPRVHRLVIALLYAGAAVLLVLDFARGIPLTAYTVPTAAAILASGVLLLVRLRRERSGTERKAGRIMVYGALGGCAPVLVFGLFPVLFPPVWIPPVQSQTVIALIALVAIPLWPLSYLWALHRPELRTFTFRGNRLLGAYGFYTLVVFGYSAFLYGAATVLLSSEGLTGPELDRGFLLVTVVSAVVLVGAVPPLRPAFQRWVDRRVFGIPYTTREVVEEMAARMPAAVDRERLGAILEHDLLPTLMIRESGLYLRRENRFETVHERNVPERPEPEVLLPRMDLLGGRHLPTENRTPIPGWIRLVLPLEVQDETLGVWTLGSRDPDDFYSRSDVSLLESLASQIAVVLKSHEEMEERRRLQHQLLSSQKMEALGRLAAGVAHDFNNLLAIILGSTELALATGELGPESRELMEEVAATCTRAANLTKQLLAFSRRRSVETEPLDLDRVVTDDQAILRSMTPSSVQLQMDLAGDLRPIRADPVQLEQVLLNLTSNAVDSMPEGGNLEIGTANVEIGAEGEQGPDEVPPGSWVRLRVRDTGTGILPEIEDRIFEPFFTTKLDGGGTGLGLALVYGIVNQSSGHVVVDSTTGVGTTFDLYFPAETGGLPAVHDGGDAARSASFPRPEDRPTESDSRRQLRILLVDDDDSVRTMAWRMLRSWGYDVLQAVDGAEALAVSRTVDGEIHLLVTDLVMPGMRGTELAAKLRELRPGIGILYVSGYPPDSILAERGDEILLAKPFTAEDLRRSVEEVVGSSPPH